MEPFEWRKLLELARLLQGGIEVKGFDRNAVLRSAVSRSYFGAFGFAVEYAAQYLDFECRNDADDHGRIRAHFKSKRRAAVADGLSKIREWRNQCDYDPSQSPDFEAMLRDAISEAEYIVSALPPPKAKS